MGMFVCVKNKQKLKNSFKLEACQYNAAQHDDEDKGNLYALLFFVFFF